MRYNDSMGYFATYVPLFNDKFRIHGALLLHHSTALRSYKSTKDYVREE